MSGPYTRVVWRGDAFARDAAGLMALGLNRATERLLAIVTPYTPALEGDLTRAYGIHEASAQTVEQGAQLQNSSPYAVFQHEGMKADGSSVIRHHTTDPHPLARTKYVEVPFREARDELFGIVGQTIAQGLR